MRPSPAAVTRALRLVGGGAEFSDQMVAEPAAVAGCTQILTFDRGVSRHAGMTSLAG